MPAGHHDVGVPGPDHLVGQVDGVQTREADLVDGVGRHREGDPALDRGLAGRDLALAGLEDLAHEHVVHLVGREPGPLQGLGDGESAQLHGGEAGEGPGQLADGGPSSRDNDGFSHDHNLRVSAGEVTGRETTSYGPTIVGAHERHPERRPGGCTRR